MLLHVTSYYCGYIISIDTPRAKLKERNPKFISPLDPPANFHSEHLDFRGSVKCPYHFLKVIDIMITVPRLQRVKYPYNIVTYC